MKKTNIAAKKYIGKVDHVSSSYAYIVVDNKESEDIFVLSKHLKGAIHNDTVRVISLGKENKHKRPEGKVLTILHRVHHDIVGRITMQMGKTICVPDHKRLHPVLVPASQGQGSKENDKVIIKIIDFSQREGKPIGQVMKIIGPSGDYGTEREALLQQFELIEVFSPAIEKIVAQIPDQLSAQEIASRRDFRQITTFTIDPGNAKDFDDALSIQALPHGEYEVGIHIADVTHYVKQDTQLDKEALKRGTSVYLVDKVIPMLPERLSNDLCSLKPQQIRPAFAVVLTLDKEANVKNVWIGETVIFSDRRFTYEEAHKIITERKGPLCKWLLVLNELKTKLRERRIRNGAIAFEATDVNIELNTKGEPIDIKPKQSIFTHHLIEEFMLLANRLVAEKVAISQKKKPFIYRIHDFPTAEKLERFSLLVKQLGYSFDVNPDKIAHSFNTILKVSKNTPNEHIIQMLAIRTMGQACYGTKQVGHFGLGFDYYTHFTSPIRRYPDVAVHRLLKHYFVNNPLPRTSYDAITKHTSIRERVAVEAERASISCHQVLFMKKLEGQEFKGIISGVTKFGLYVEIIQNKCEGMVKIANLVDDYYTFDPTRLCLQGQRTQRVYQLGNQVSIRIQNCDIHRKTIDFVLVK